LVDVPDLQGYTGPVPPGLLGSVIDGSQEDAEDRPVRVSARKKALLDRRILEERKTAFETHKELVFVLRCKAAGDREGGGYGDDG